MTETTISSTVAGLETFITDCERRIGNYIAAGGSHTDPHVARQIKFIHAATLELVSLLTLPNAV